MPAPDPALRRLVAWLLPGGTSLGARAATPREEPGPDGWTLEGRVIPRVGPGGEARPLARLSRCTLDGARIEDARIGAVEACLARGSRWTRVRVDRLTLTDLEDAVLEDVRFGAVEAASLRGVRCEGGAFERLALADLSQARLTRVRLGEALGADLSGATLEACDLAGADLRGAVLRGVRFVRTDPTAARIEGADLRGARGLDRTARRRLILAGARFRAAGWARGLGRILPGADPVRIEAAAAVVEIASLAIAGLACLLALVAVLRPPQVQPIPEVPPARARPATPDEVETTQRNLARLREAMAVAHEAMIRNGAGAVTWPSHADLEQNRYDVDGDGPGEVRATLVPGGLPENLLTDARGGVLPYCNDEPTQATLAGVDADWHYCDRIGRVFASAGYTGQPTLGW